MSSLDHLSEKQIDLPESAWTVLEYMMHKKIPIECNRIVELWQDDWECCPLCNGALIPYENGDFCTHFMKQ